MSLQRRVQKWGEGRCGWLEISSKAISAQDTITLQGCPFCRGKTEAQSGVPPAQGPHPPGSPATGCLLPPSHTDTLVPSPGAPFSLVQ